MEKYLRCFAGIMMLAFAGKLSAVTLDVPMALTKDGAQIEWWTTSGGVVDVPLEKYAGNPVWGEGKYWLDMNCDKTIWHSGMTVGYVWTKLPETDFIYTCVWGNRLVSHDDNGDGYADRSSYTGESVLYVVRFNCADENINPTERLDLKLLSRKAVVSTPGSDDYCQITYNDGFKDVVFDLVPNHISVKDANVNNTNPWPQLSIN